MCWFLSLAAILFLLHIPSAWARYSIGRTPLAPDTQLIERGFVRIPGALPRDEVLLYSAAVAAAVEFEHQQCSQCTLDEAKDMRHESCYGCLLSSVKSEPGQGEVHPPFLLSRRLLQADPTLAALVLSPTLAGKAATAMGMERLRLYHASAFIKRPGDGPSIWHQDAAPTPLDTDIMATLWVALADVEPECGLLRFVSGFVGA